MMTHRLGSILRNVQGDLLWCVLLPSPFSFQGVFEDEAMYHCSGSLAFLVACGDLTTRLDQGG